MTTNTRARVRKAKSRTFWVISFTGVPGVKLLPRFAFSWPEAMQEAHARLAELDRALMDEVHASRASRRIPEPEALDAAANEFAAMLAAGRPLDYAIAAAGQVASITTDAHTMEATA